MLLGCSLYISLFGGGGNFFNLNLNNHFFYFDFFYDSFFFFKTLFLVFILIYLRANLPRYRFDQIMLIGLKNFVTNYVRLYLFIYWFFIIFKMF